LAKRKQSRSKSLRRLVEERAGRRCEYCHAPQQVSGYRYHIDHIIPSARGGSHGLTNRALACAACNLTKIDRTDGVDPETGRRTALFHPRRQKWDDHFEWADDDETLLGLTPEGRATIRALDMNSEYRRESRRLWFATGWLP
jgi:HNH endonuclease